MALDSRSIEKILIVDDDPILAALYRNKLRIAGYRVEVAESGAAGLTKVSEVAPDLVVLDLMLGDMNGIDVLKELRGSPATQDLPVIVFSSVFLSTLINEAKSAGATRCLNKFNCPPPRLIDEIKSVASGAPEPATPAESAETAPPAEPAAPPPPPPAAAPSESRPRLRLSGEIPRDTDTPPAISVEGSPAAFQRDIIEQIRRRIGDAERVLPKWAQDPHNVDAPFLGVLYRSVRAIAGSASLAGRMRLGHVAGLLEALLRDIKQTRGASSDTYHRPVAQAVGMLSALAGDDDLIVESLPSPLIIVVDDEVGSRERICGALQDAQLSSIQVADAETAARLFEWNLFDLAIIDLEIAGPGGIGLASGLRDEGSLGDAPVVFVTDNLEAAQQQIEMDGHKMEVIARPIQPLELAMAAMIKVYGN